MIDKTTPLGPNVKRLIAVIAAQVQMDAAKERFGKAGVGEVAVSLMERGAGGLQDSMRKAFDKVAIYLETARRAPGSEQWPTDEDMAGEMVRRIEEQQKG